MLQILVKYAHNNKEKSQLELPPFAYLKALKCPIERTCGASSASIFHKLDHKSTDIF